MPIVINEVRIEAVPPERQRVEATDESAAAEPDESPLERLLATESAKVHRLRLLAD